MSINLENVLGFRVRITNVLDVVTEGRIYAYNSDSNILTLQTGRKTSAPAFKVIKCSFIKTLEVLGDKPPYNSFKKQQIKPGFVNVERVESLLQERMSKYSKLHATRGKNVSREAQLIFDLIYKTVPNTRWSGKKILVLDDIEVVPPYKLTDVHPLQNDGGSSIHLVQRIVQRAWDEIKEGTPELKGG